MSGEVCVLISWPLFRSPIFIRVESSEQPFEFLTRCFVEQRTRVHVLIKRKTSPAGLTVVTDRRP
jgi:hypothetical protein